MTIEYGQAFVDVLDRNNSERLRARLAAARRREDDSKEGSVPPEGARPRSLPSGPAPSWTGFALSLALLGISALGLSVAVVGFVAINAVQNAISRQKKAAQS